MQVAALQGELSGLAAERAAAVEQLQVQLEAAAAQLQSKEAELVSEGRQQPGCICDAASPAWQVVRGSLMCCPVLAHSPGVSVRAGASAPCHRGAAVQAGTITALRTEVTNAQQAEEVARRELAGVNMRLEISCGLEEQVRGPCGGGQRASDGWWAHRLHLGTMAWLVLSEHSITALAKPPPLAPAALRRSPP